jgi:hypothetical protein
VVLPVPLTEIPMGMTVESHEPTRSSVSSNISII